mgnify:FL=1
MESCSEAVSCIKLRITRLEYLAHYELPLFHNPYCVIILGNRKESTFTYKNAGRHPEWNQLYQLMLYGTETSLKFQIFNSEPLKKDELIGEGEIEISKINKTGKHGHWVKIVSSYVHIGSLVIGCESNELPELSKCNPENSDMLIQLEFQPCKERVLKKQGVIKEELHDFTSITREHIRQQKELQKESLQIEEETKENPKDHTNGVLSKITKWYSMLLGKKQTEKQEIPPTLPQTITTGQQKIFKSGEWVFDAQKIVDIETIPTDRDLLPTDRDLLYDINTKPTVLGTEKTSDKSE